MGGGGEPGKLRRARVHASDNPGQDTWKDGVFEKPPLVLLVHQEDFVLCFMYKLHFVFSETALV